jgi:hypothetical protein
MPNLPDHLEEHLPYELSMLVHTFDRLYNTTDEADWNAFLESFCVHARNLKMFLTNDAGKGNNGLRARDFVANFHVKVPAQLTGAFQRLNEQTTHLAKNRTIEPKEKFTRDDAQKVQDWLASAMRDFCGRLSPADKARWNKSSKQKKVVHVPSGTPTATNHIQTMTYTTIAMDEIVSTGLGNTLRFRV